MTELPDYADLPPAPGGGRSGWGLFGAGDNLGLVNLMTPQRIAAAARLVRRGQIFCLDMPLGSISPAVATFRGPPRHRVLHQPGTVGFDDVYDNFYPQAASQWDSLAHVGYAPDQMYNGATEEDVLAGTRNTIEHWARHGMAGRAVLLDTERAMRDAGRPYDPGGSSSIGVADLELARRQAGVDFAAGDIILLHTGFAAWYLQQPSQVKNRLHGNVAAPGIEHTEAVCDTCGTVTRRLSPRTPTASRSSRPTAARKRTRSASCTTCSSGSSGWPWASCGGSATWPPTAPPTASTRCSSSARR